DGTFDPPIAMPEHGDTGVVPEYAFSADINHDGSADAIVFYGSRVGLFFNILNPAARVQAFIDGGSLSEDWRTMMRVGDFNNDGLLDVLLNGTKCERYDVPCHFLSFIGEFAVEFLRGDANADDLLNISDASTILGY